MLKYNDKHKKERDLFERERILDEKAEKIFWENYSPNYDLLKNVPEVIELREFHSKNMPIDGMILDGGCGDGLLSCVLASTGERIIYSVDHNKDMLKIAGENTKGYNNIELSYADVLKLPFNSNFFDGVVSNNVFHFLRKEDQPLFFSEMKRVIKPDGVVSISAALPDFDMDLMINAAYKFYTRINAPNEVMGRLKKMAEDLIGYVNNMDRSKLLDVAGIIEQLKEYGYGKIIDSGKTYLNQNFYAIVKK